jgi:G3E family GTPase
LLIGGWLGAGKTTLVNQLLRQAQGRRLAVLVNDFGELGLDAALITGTADEVLELAGGCICCSYGADLVGTVRRVAARVPRADALLLEASGVSDPAAVARSLRLVDSVMLDSTLVVADAGCLPRQLGDPYVGDTVRRQLAAADLLLLNKVDGVEAAARLALHALLATAAPRASVRESVRAQVPIDAVLGRVLAGVADRGGNAGACASSDASSDANVDVDGRTLQVPRPDTGRYRSRSTLLTGPQDPLLLARRLTSPGAGVLRAKGLLTDAQGRRHLLQVAGGRAEIAPAPSGASGPDRLIEIVVPTDDASPSQP